MIITTKDGSHTIQVEGSGLTYHSIHGAIGESMHVFISAGLNHYLELQKPKAISIFEMGFGTGLNAFLSLLESQKKNIFIRYTAVETHPLSENEYSALNYAEASGDPLSTALFHQLHLSEWNSEIPVNSFFSLEKINAPLQSFIPARSYDIIYFDAFAPGAQPELWTEDIFKKMFSLLNPGGILVTYCSKGDVRRAMQAAGFSVQKIPGPRGKREMLRATKR